MRYIRLKNNRNKKRTYTCCKKKIHKNIDIDNKYTSFALVCGVRILYPGSKQQRVEKRIIFDAMYIDRSRRDECNFISFCTYYMHYFITCIWITLSFFLFPC